MLEFSISEKYSMIFRYSQSILMEPHEFTSPAGARLHTKGVGASERWADRMGRATSWGFQAGFMVIFHG